MAGTFQLTSNWTASVFNATVTLHHRQHVSLIFIEGNCSPYRWVRWGNRWRGTTAGAWHPERTKKHIYAGVRSQQPSSGSPLSFGGTSLPLWCAWPNSHPCACPGCAARWPPSHRGRRPRPLRPHSAVWRVRARVNDTAGPKRKFRT